MEIFDVFDYNFPTGSLSRSGRKPSAQTKAKSSNTKLAKKRLNQTRAANNQVRQKAPSLSKSEVMSKIRDMQSQKSSEQKALVNTDKNTQSSSKKVAKGAVIQRNDPNDSNTQNKLKEVLKSGLISFRPGERAVLEKILS